MTGLSRRQRRYWCFRLRTAATGGAPADDAPAGLVAHYEGLAGFPGWAGFGAVWDLDADDPSSIVPRAKSVHQEWAEVLADKVPELACAEDNP